MHPGAQEIVFVLDGGVIVEVEGEGSKELDPGGCDRPHSLNCARPVPLLAASSAFASNLFNVSSAIAAGA
jgi:hypothetical protein